MPTHQPEALNFMLTRRSRPAKTLIAPGPDRAALTPMLEAAARVPDHGKLEPWRFIVLGQAAMGRLADLAHKRAMELELGEEKAVKGALMFRDAPMMVAVVSGPVESEKVPEVEQVLSAGAVCLSLLNAALASGWGANWLSGPMSLDRAFLRDGLSLADHETVAGFLVIGTETSPPPERPRPDLDTKTEWVAA